jgi:hypothetical protein
MDYDTEKVDEAVLALLFLTTHGDKFGTRAWKGHDWDTLGRLHQKGYIGDPAGKAKSVVITVEGEVKSEELFWKLFGKSS